MKPEGGPSALAEARRRLESGAFARQPPLVRGDEVRALILRLSVSDLPSGEVPEAWSLIREMVRQTLVGLATQKASARSGATRLTVGFALYGAPDRFRFEGIQVDEVDRAAARMVGVVGPGLASIVPEPHRAWTEMRPPL